MIRFESISKNYGSISALKNISFTIQENQITGLLGANGAGKSTCMKIMSGAMRASSGKYFFSDKELLSGQNVWKTQVGYLPEKPPVYEDLTVSENLYFWAEILGLNKEDISTEVNRVIQSCGLEDYSHQLAKVLSKGYRQRLGLAKSILAKPKLLILDEPLSGLDPKQMIEIRDLIKALGKTHSIIFSSHQLYEVELLCDHYLFLNHGQIIAQGSKHDILKQVQKPLLQLEFFEALPASVKLSAVQKRLQANIMEIEIEDDKESIQNLLVLMNEHGLFIKEMKWKRQSLEDVFLNLVSKEGGHSELQYL